MDRYLDDVSHYSGPSSSGSNCSRYSQYSTLVNERDDLSHLSISDTLLTDGITRTPYGQYFGCLSSCTNGSIYDNCWMNEISSKNSPTLLQTPRKGTRLRRTVSRSQPDLSKLKQKREDSSLHISNSPLAEKILMKAGSPRKSPKVKEDDCWTNAELLDALLQENLVLKEEVRLQAAKLEKLSRLESELCSIQASHQALIRMNERRETLERTARLRLECETRKLQELNEDLRNQVDMLTNRILSGLNTCPAGEIGREMAQRDLTIARLLSQNKELMSLKNQQEIELSAQRATLQEQRKHIDLLDAALAVKSQCKCQNYQESKKQVSGPVQGAGSQELVGRQLEGERGALRVSQRSQGSVKSVGTDSGDSGIAAPEPPVSSLPPAYPLLPSDSTNLRQQLWEAQKHIELLRGQMQQWQRPPGTVYELKNQGGVSHQQDTGPRRSNLRATIPIRKSSPLPPRASLRSLPRTKAPPSGRGGMGPHHGSVAQIGNSSLSIAAQNDQRVREFSSPSRIDLGYTPLYLRTGHSPSPFMARTPSTGSEGKMTKDKAKCQLTSYARFEPEIAAPASQEKLDYMIHALRNEQQRYPGHFQ
ncbi:angiomotin-like protein 2 isoform X2 [Artemia franciscana]